MGGTDPGGPVYRSQLRLANKEGEDPDVASRVLVFTSEASDRRTGWVAALARRQGFYFPPAVLRGLVPVHRLDQGPDHQASTQATLARTRLPDRSPRELRGVLVRRSPARHGRRLFRRSGWRLPPRSGV